MCVPIQCAWGACWPFSACPPCCKGKDRCPGKACSPHLCVLCCCGSHKVALKQTEFWDQFGFWFVLLELFETNKKRITWILGKSPCVFLNHLTWRGSQWSALNIVKSYYLFINKDAETVRASSFPVQGLSSPWTANPILWVPKSSWNLLLKCVALAFLNKHYSTLNGCLVGSLLQWKVSPRRAGFRIPLQEDRPNLGIQRLSFLSQFFHFLSDHKQTTQPFWVLLIFFFSSLERKMATSISLPAREIWGDFISTKAIWKWKHYANIGAYYFH